MAMNSLLIYQLLPVAVMTTRRSTMISFVWIRIQKMHIGDRIGKSLIRSRATHGSRPEIVGIKKIVERPT